MSTQVRDVAGGYEVSTLDKSGKRRGRPTGRVVVYGLELGPMMAEVERQAGELRKKLGIQQPKEEPVV